MSEGGGGGGGGKGWTLPPMHTGDYFACLGRKGTLYLEPILLQWTFLFRNIYLETVSKTLLTSNTI